MFYYDNGSVQSGFYRQHTNNCCDFCLKLDCVRLSAISDGDKILASKLVPKYMKERLISSYGIPQYACRTCYRKLHLFKHYLRRFLKTNQKNQHYKPLTNIKQEEKEIPNQYNNATMATPPDNDVTSSTTTSVKHEYNCQCDSCQNKYGSLPLLVQVIEEQRGANEAAVQHSETSSSRISTDEVAATSSSGALPSETGVSYKKQLKCLHCSKILSHRGDFNKHLRIHTKEKPFSCRECDKTFPHTSNLHRHMKIHSGDKPFVCTVCEKCFSRKDKLDSHRRSKTCIWKCGELQ